MWIYLPAEELEAAGRPLNGKAEAPWYRVWATRRGSVYVQLYKDA